MSVEPSYSTSPSGVCTTASIRLRVLRLKMRTRVSPGVAFTSPASIANGPTPDSMFPQFGPVSTTARSIETCAKR